MINSDGCTYFVLTISEGLQYNLGIRILMHMEQLSYILREYSEKIFSLQGLFIGNWGEMNGTRYSTDEDLQKLAKSLPV